MVELTDRAKSFTLDPERDLEWLPGDFSSAGNLFDSPDIFLNILTGLIVSKLSASFSTIVSSRMSKSFSVDCARSLGIFFGWMLDLSFPSSSFDVSDLKKLYTPFTPFICLSELSSDNL